MINPGQVLDGGQGSVLRFQARLFTEHSQREWILREQILGGRDGRERHAGHGQTVEGEMPRNLLLLGSILRHQIHLFVNNGAVHECEKKRLFFLFGFNKKLLMSDAFGRVSAEEERDFLARRHGPNFVPPPTVITSRSGTSSAFQSHVLGSSQSSHPATHANSNHHASQPPSQPPQQNRHSQDQHRQAQPHHHPEPQQHQQQSQSHKHEILRLRNALTEKDLEMIELRAKHLRAMSDMEEERGLLEDRLAATEDDLVRARASNDAWQRSVREETARREQELQTLKDALAAASIREQQLLQGLPDRASPRNHPPQHPAQQGQPRSPASRDARPPPDTARLQKDLEQALQLLTTAEVDAVHSGEEISSLRQALATERANNAELVRALDELRRPRPEEAIIRELESRLAMASDEAGVLQTALDEALRENDSNRSLGDNVRALTEYVRELEGFQAKALEQLGSLERELKDSKAALRHRADLTATVAAVAKLVPGALRHTRALTRMLDLMLRGEEPDIDLFLIAEDPEPPAEDVPAAARELVAGLLSLRTRLADHYADRVGEMMGHGPGGACSIS